MFGLLIAIVVSAVIGIGFLVLLQCAAMVLYGRGWGEIIGWLRDLFGLHRIPPTLRSRRPVQDNSRKSATSARDTVPGNVKSGRTARKTISDDEMNALEAAAMEGATALNKFLDAQNAGEAVRVEWLRGLFDSRITLAPPWKPYNMWREAWEYTKPVAIAAVVYVGILHSAYDERSWVQDLSMFIAVVYFRDVAQKIYESAK